MRTRSGSRAAKGCGGAAPEQTPAPSRRRQTGPCFPFPRLEDGALRICWWPPGAQDARQAHSWLVSRRSRDPISGPARPAVAAEHLGVVAREPPPWERARTLRSRGGGRGGGRGAARWAGACEALIHTRRRVSRCPSVVSTLTDFVCEIEQLNGRSESDDKTLIVIFLLRPRRGIRGVRRSISSTGNGGNSRSPAHICFPSSPRETAAPSRLRAGVSPSPGAPRPSGACPGRAEGKLTGDPSRAPHSARLPAPHARIRFKSHTLAQAGTRGPQSRHRRVPGRPLTRGRRAPAEGRGPRSQYLAP